MDTFKTNDTTPLGAKYNSENKSVEFRIYSKNASKILLCIFEKPQGENPVMVLNMERGENDIWCTAVKNYILGCDKHRP